MVTCTPHCCFVFKKKSVAVYNISEPFNTSLHITPQPSRMQYEENLDNNRKLSMMLSKEDRMGGFKLEFGFYSR